MVASKILGLTSILDVVVTSSSLLGEEELGEGESVDDDVSVSVEDGEGAGKSKILTTKANTTLYRVTMLAEDYCLLILTLSMKLHNPAQVLCCFCTF